MENIVFLYDQVAECIARLHAFASARSDHLGDGDVEDDVNALTGLLAQRDLLVLAASTRNFVETARATQSARVLKIQTSEIFISAGPPFFRDTKISITIYQCLSRILHAHNLRIYRCASDYFAAITTDANDFFSRSKDYEKHGGDCFEYLEPLIGMTTERERLTLVRLTQILNSVCALLNDVSGKLEKKMIFLSHDIR